MVAPGAGVPPAHTINACWVILYVLSSADLFKINFLEKFFQEYHQSVHLTSADNIGMHFGPRSAPTVLILIKTVRTSESV